jgi:hypothetical protein
MLPLLLTALTLAADPPRNLLFEELTRDGLAIPGGPRVKLPPPVLPDGLSASRKQAIVDKLADKFPPGLFVRKMVTAPYLLTIKSIGEGPKRRGHTVRLVFIAHGKLEQLEKENALEQLMGLERKDETRASAKALTDEELAQRKIKRVKTPGLEESYARLDAVLVDKVKLTGVVRGLASSGKKSLLFACRLDERFADDKKYPNRWRSIGPPPAEKLGRPEPYTGFGGYLEGTELPRPAGALLIEAHFAFWEPHGWFQGYNVLASKLPLAVRNNVQTFRRKLAKAR